MIGAILGAVAPIIGGVLGASSQKKAAKKAADAQLQIANQNNALIRELYGRNEQNFTPYMDSGGRANALIDSFLYGAPQQAPAAPQQQPPMAPQGAMGNLQQGGYGIGDSLGGMTAFNARGARNLNTLYSQQPQPMAPAPAPQAAAPQGNGMSGYDAFVASPYYQHPLQEGFRALNHGLASGGMLNSGAAAKEAIKFGQNYGAGRQDEFLNLARGQQQTGFGAASALAGIGQNTTGMMVNQNQNSADALSNAALLRGQANSNMWGGIAGALGGIAGGLGSSYGGR